MQRTLRGSLKFVPIQAEDMRAAVEFLRDQGKTVVGLVGHSKAGSGVILYAAKYDDIPRVVNISGRFDNQRGRFQTNLLSDPLRQFSF